MKNKRTILYNLFFPVWILVWLPSFLWLIIIPLNYLLDRVIFTINARKQNSGLTKEFFRKHTWKLFLLGFVADFAGSILLLIPLLIRPSEETAMNYNETIFGKFMNALQFNAFENPLALLYTLFAIAVAGLLIYNFDRLVIQKTGEFTREQARKIALFMAIFTAPYLYLIPAGLFY